MKRRTKWIMIGVAALVVLGASAALAVSGGEDSVAVRIETAQERDLVATVTASGWIRPRTSVNVQADIMGRITDLQVAEGDLVQAGQTLMRIDPSQYEAVVARARAGVSEARAAEAQARANLVQAQAALERVEGLAASDARLVSERELEEARTAVRVQEALHEAARFRVDQSQAALREAQDQLGKTVIRAPLSGVVTRLNVEQGEMAIIGTMNNPGSLLLTISDLSIMEAVVQVDETDVPEISIGDSAIVEVDALPGQRFHGVVTEIGHSAVQSPAAAAEAGGPAAQIPIDFEVVITLSDAPPTLRPDLSTSADVVTAVRDSTLTVPIIALTVREVEAEDLPVEQPEARRAQAATEDDAEREGVFLVREGKAEFVPVTVGITGREFFEVLSGLQAGDSIVAGPYDAIREMEDGDGVMPLPVTAAGDDAVTGT